MNYRWQSSAGNVVSRWPNVNFRVAQLWQVFTLTHPKPIVFKSIFSSKVDATTHQLLHILGFNVGMNGWLTGGQYFTLVEKYPAGGLLPLDQRQIQPPVDIMMGL